MVRVALRALVVLGYLVGRAESQVVGSEAVGRSPLQLVGLLLTAVLFYVVFSGAIIALFSRVERRKNGTVGPLSVTDLATADAEPGHVSPEAPKVRRA